MSNLKQIGLGMMQYTQDYDEKYPSAAWNPGVEQTDASMPGSHFKISTAICASGECVSWMDIIYPYVKSVQVFVCPSARYSSDNPSYGYSNAISGWQITNYDSTLTGVSNRIPLSMSTVQRPSEIVMLLDYNFSASFYANPYEVGRASRSTATNQLRVLPHLDGANIAYADGHVKWTNGANFRKIPDVNTRCNLSSVTSANAYCDKNWNPLIP